MSVISRDSSLSLRQKWILSLFPDLWLWTIFTTDVGSFTSTSSILKRTSPFWSPAFAAGLSADTSRTTTPDLGASLSVAARATPRNAFPLEGDLSAGDAVGDAPKTRHGTPAKESNTVNQFRTDTPPMKMPSGITKNENNPIMPNRDQLDAGSEFPLLLRLQATCCLGKWAPISFTPFGEERFAAWEQYRRLGRLP